MTMNESEILYETPGGRFWVKRNGDLGFCVLKSGVTHSTCVAFIGNGSGPRLGLKRAISEADRRDLHGLPPEGAPDPEVEKIPKAIDRDRPAIR